MTAARGTRQEGVVYGPRWEKVHGGYFADPAVARPLVAAVLRVWRETPAATIADLGGGTGFILRELARSPLLRGTRLVNVEPATRQAGWRRDARIEWRRARVECLRRRQLAAPRERLLLVLRSLLHYHGQAGLLPLLRRIRRLARPGEALVHQTACFATAAQARCLNRIYDALHTGKWYPTHRQLEAALRQAGWRVEAIRPAPALRLDAAGLARRFGAPPAVLRRIRRDAVTAGDPATGVFRPAARGFVARLHYRVYLCRAV